MRAYYWLVALLVMSPGGLWAQEEKETPKEHGHRTEKQEHGEKGEREKREHDPKREHDSKREHGAKGEHSDKGEVKGEHAKEWESGELSGEQRSRALRAMAAEIETHRSRAARIKRLRVLAEEKGDKERLAELKRLASKENERHRAVLNRFEERLGTKDYAKARSRALQHIEGAKGRGDGKGHGREYTPEERRRHEAKSKGEHGDSGARGRHGSKDHEAKGRGETHEKGRESGHGQRGHDKKPAKGHQKSDQEKEG